MKTATQWRCGLRHGGRRHAVPRSLITPADRAKMLVVRTERAEGSIVGRGAVPTAARRAAMAVFVAAMLLLQLGSARAAPQTFVTLEYDVASDARGCPTLEDFKSRVERQLKYDPFRADAERRVALHITRSGPGYEGLIHWSDAHGHADGDRRLRSLRGSCDELAANLVFAVAVQIQLLPPPAPAEDEPSPPPPPATSPPLESSSPPTAPEPAHAAAQDMATAAEPRPQEPQASRSLVEPPAGPEPTDDADARERSLRFLLGLGPSLALGIAPHATALGRIFVAARLDGISFELSADGAWPAQRRLPDHSGFSFRRLALGTALCGHADPVAVCALGAFGALGAKGLGLDQSRSPSAGFAQVGARLAATTELTGQFFLSARVDGLVMLSRGSVSLDGVIAWTTPRLAAVPGVDFGAFF